MEQKKFAMGFVLIIGIFLCVALCIAYIGNPGEAFRPSPMEEMAEALLSGEKIIPPPDYDAFLFQKIIIQHDNVKRDIIVLGSSRAIPVTQAMITSDTGKTFWNHAIPWGLLDHDLELLGMYVENGYLPDTVVFDLPPWVLDGRLKLGMRHQFLDLGNFESNNQIPFYHSLQINYNELMKWCSAVSYPILRVAVAAILNPADFSWKIDNDDVDINESEKADETTAEKIARIDNYTRELHANMNIEWARYQALMEFHVIDPTLRQKFESTIAYLQASGVNVIFVLVPPHPILYDIMISDPNPKMVLEVEKYFKTYAAEHNIPVYGSYDPHVFGFTSLDFLDGSHLTPEAIQVIFQTVSKESELISEEVNSTGEGVAVDREKAVYWYTVCAEQGTADAQTRLGNRYYYGDGVEQDYQKAVEWYTRAAEQGNTEAQTWLGNRYYYGDGVEQDYQKAAEWFTRAAVQGNAEAQNYLGWHYATGNGVEQDYQKAAEWYTLAAVQGNAAAQDALDNFTFYS